MKNCPVCEILGEEIEFNIEYECERCLSKFRINEFEEIEFIYVPTKQKLEASTKAFVIIIIEVIILFLILCMYNGVPVELLFIYSIVSSVSPFLFFLKEMVYHEVELTMAESIIYSITGKIKKYNIKYQYLGKILLINEIVLLLIVLITSIICFF